MGLGNLFLILFICIGILVFVVCCTFLIVGGCECNFSDWCVRNKGHGTSNRQYRFSLLTKKSNRPKLFEDEFEDDEAEEILFNSSLNSEYWTPLFTSNQPKISLNFSANLQSFKDHVDSYSDGTDGSDEEDIVMIRRD